MRVLLDPTVFVAGYRLELLVLAWLAGSGRHRILPLAPSTAQTTWEEGLDLATATRWRDAMALSVQRDATAPPSREVIVCDTKDSALAQVPPRLCVQDSMRLLLRPYCVLLENNVNDRAFVLAVCREAERTELERAEANGWLIFEMGGGTAMIARAQELCRRELGEVTSSALADSDKLAPSDPPGPNAKALQALGNTYPNFHAHTLQRRSIENYLSAKALQSQNPRAAQAHQNMSQDQQWHFNVKSGFDGDARRAARVTLYANLTPATQASLAKGFGTHAAGPSQWKIGAPDIKGRNEMTQFAQTILARLR